MSLYYEQRGIEVDSDILIFAFRYALGRRTFAPTIVSETIKRNLNHLLTFDLFNIAHEIQQEYEVDGLGEDCDVMVWMDLQRTVEKEIERREHGNR